MSVRRGSFDLGTFLSVTDDPIRVRKKNVSEVFKHLAIPEVVGFAKIKK